MKHSRIIRVGIALIVGLTLLGVPSAYVGEAVTIKKDEKKEEGRDALGVYLDTLATYECRDCPDGYRRLDSNQKYSFGCLQFQKRTFDAMVARYRLVPEREYDNSLDIVRCEDQKRVARAMFQDDPGRASLHWFTSIYKRGLGLP